MPLYQGPLNQEQDARVLTHRRMGQHVTSRGKSTWAQTAAHHTMRTITSALLQTSWDRFQELLPLLGGAHCI